MTANALAHGDHHGAGHTSPAQHSGGTDADYHSDHCEQHASAGKHAILPPPSALEVTDRATALPSWSLGVAAASATEVICRVDASNASLPPADTPVSLHQLLPD